LAHLVYVNKDGSEVSFVHLFPDAEAMDILFQSADERSKQVYEFMQPKSMEISGSPSNGVLEMMKRMAGSGVVLKIKLQHMSGY
jgi:hypothetical protein